MTDLSRIERAILTVASLIEQSGEDYWPVMERLEAERDTLLSRQSRLAAYLRRAGPAGGRSAGLRHQTPRQGAGQTLRLRSAAPAADTSAYSASASTI